MAGYSPNPLYKKLGLKEGQSITIIYPPEGYEAMISEAAGGLIQASAGLDFIQLFTNSRKELADALPVLKRQIKRSGAIWISWYKKSANKPTKLTENLIRDMVLANGLVDVKVCAIDDSWSALKLVLRAKDR
jgi:hypothetical protein